MLNQDDDDDEEVGLYLYIFIYEGSILQISQLLRLKYILVEQSRVELSNIHLYVSQVKYSRLILPKEKKKSASPYQINPCSSFSNFFHNLLHLQLSHHFPHSLLLNNLGFIQTKQNISHWGPFGVTKQQCQIYVGHPLSLSLSAIFWSRYSS